MTQGNNLKGENAHEYSDAYSFERRGFASTDDTDLALYADADPAVAVGEEISSCDRSDLIGNHSETNNVLRSGGPPADFAANFDVDHYVDPTAAVPEDQKHLVTPSGATGAFLGLCLGGPIGAALWGFGAAYAVRKDGTIGDAARTLGEIGLTVQEKFHSFDERHQVTKWTQETIDESKVAKMAASTFNDIADYTRRHQLLERGIENTGRGFEYLADKIAGNGRSSSSSAPSVVDDYDYRPLNT